MTTTKTANSKLRHGFGKARSLGQELDKLNSDELAQLKQSLTQQKQTLLSQLHQARLTYNSIERQRNKALHNLNRLQRDFDTLADYTKQHHLSDELGDDYYTN